MIPSQIEQVVNQHQCVETSVAVGIPHKDQLKGQMIGVCIKRKEPFLQTDITNDVFDFLSQRLQADYIPFMEIRMVNEFPSTSCGKVDKIALARIACEE